MKKHRPNTICLSGYDYSQEGLYFITICIQEKLCLLGSITDGENTLNPAGEMIEYWYNELENKYRHLRCHDYIIMPNHVHFIIELKPGGCADISLIINWFKTMTTNEYIKHVYKDHWHPFNKRFWQRNYFEHIIRNQHAYDNIVEYINNNPSNWDKDTLYM